jgi:hypothetical protein
LGDVDGDGDTDLLLPCGSDQQLFLNDGTGHFAPGGSFPPDGQDFTLGDVDDDGDLDAFGALYTSSANFRADLLYINDGQGHFADETGTRLPDSAGYNGVQSMLADLDGDGDLDGIILGWAHDPEYILLNDGTGHFSRSMHFLPGAFATPWSVRYEPGDIDSDGDIDLVLPDPNYVDNIILLNQGNAQFEWAPSSLFLWLQGACRDQGGNTICTNAALGDVNNDGALDLFLTRSGGLDTTQQNLLFIQANPAKIFLPLVSHRAP